MSKKKLMVLGYTRTGIEVRLPNSRTPDDDFAGWTRGDHLDASRILTEHGEREKDAELGSWCTRWAKVHRALRKASKRKSARIRGGAEISIRVNGSR